MSDLRRELPSLGRLAVFDAAARHKSFSRAGQELAMSQAAVSYAVRALEDELGVALFLRQHRGVALTDAGARFFVDVTMALAHLRESARSIRQLSGTEPVTLSVSTAFATYWLLPRLAGLRARHPHVDLRVQTTDRDVDIAAEGIALGVRYGQGVRPHYDRAVLAAETIFPVCSRAYLDSLGARAEIQRPEDLTRAALVHLDEPYRPCPIWDDWFRANGVPASGRVGGLRLNDYALVVQAVIEGQGVALGWEHLVDHLVARNTLVRPVEAAWTTGTHFYVVWAGSLQPAATTVREWLLAQARAVAAPSPLDRPSPAA